MEPQSYTRRPQNDIYIPIFSPTQPLREYKVREYVYYTR